ncbi:MAG: hypothetical protein Q7T50_06915, partial [Candidatus Magasanikbacteria bacterium]|nr:hypothetical protein [Candidatus Magasanikbacteria bacterium]
FAWSQNLGWIYFGPDVNLSGFGDVLEADAPADPKQWAMYDFDTNQVNGWARALSLGADGWISLNGTWASGVEVDPATYDFSGFAWNGNDTGNSIGWISFNCLDMPRTCSGGSNAGTPCPIGTECLGGGVCMDTCSLANYKVSGITNQPPVVKNLQAPFLSNDELCGPLGVRSAVLKWDFEDLDTASYETAYQIIFDDDDDPSDPLLATEKCTFNTTHVDCLVAPGVDKYPVHESGKISLQFGEHYYWWVKVWDNMDSASDWVASTDDWGADFLVPGHEYPDVTIDDYWPDNPSVGESVFFKGSSAIYEYGNPSLSIPCENDGVNCSWEWSVSPDDHATVSNANGVDPEVVFDSSAVRAYYVTLKVTDKDDFYCSATQEIKAKYKLPKWIEVKGDEN